MPRFTAETARENAIKGNIARWSRPPEPHTEPAPVAIPASIAEDVADEYREANVARVRKQLDRLHRLLDAEEEPAKIDRLVAAIGRLNEIERQCAGRSLPPTLRANDKRGSNRRPGGQPTPQQVAPCVPAPAPVRPQTPQDDVSH